MELQVFMADLIGMMAVKSRRQQHFQHHHQNLMVMIQFSELLFELAFSSLHRWGMGDGLPVRHPLL